MHLASDPTPSAPSNTPDAFLYERLAASLTALIEAGTLRPGERLPSVRRFSAQQRVSVSTVLQAYRLLEDRRLVEARPQSGFYVRAECRTRPAEPSISTPSLAAQPVGVGAFVAEVSAVMADPSIVPLGAAVPSPDLLPTDALNRTLASVVRRTGWASNTYLPPQGDADLRHEVARRALDTGATLAPDDLVITNGCMEALALCLRAVAREGDTVIVESPAYFGILQLIESLHLKALEVATDPREGLCLNELERALTKRRVVACIVTPNFHNPLGSRMPEAKKEILVRLCAVHDVPLLEDDLYGDLYFEAPRPTSLKAYDETGGVLSCSSFSKTMAPGYRIGWAAPGRYRDAVIRLKLASTIMTAAPLQHALTSFLQKGGVEVHLRRLRRAYADNLARLTQAVGEHFPEGTRATRPQGGFVLWVELPEAVSAVALYQEALRRKISIAPGPIFSATGQYAHHIRLSGGYPWSDRTDRALKTLGRTARRLQESGS
ncbi:MAG: PLP-dependent aminotransferase family protein [Rhodothermaceae bacterium]|nr:PLP-dependent aminotransferase family protein [Rhodothermaceae bacterium]